MIKYIILLISCSRIFGQQAFSIFDPAMHGVSTVQDIPVLTITNAFDGAATNTFAWYDGATFSGEVWTNKSLRANLNMSNGNSASQPDASTVDGFLSVFFNGSDWLTNALFKINQPWEAWLVVCSTNKQVDSIYQVIFDSVASSGRNLLAVRGDTKTYEMYAGTDTFSETIITNRLIVLRAIFNGASSALWTNGAAGATRSVGALNQNGITVGSRFTTSQYFATMHIAEFVAFDKVLDSLSVSNVNFVLTNKYSITQP